MAKTVKTKTKKTPAVSLDPLSKALKASFLRQSLRRKHAGAPKPSATEETKDELKPAAAAPKRKPGEEAARLGDTRYPRSPLAPKTLAVTQPVAGMKIATMATGQKYKGRDDLFLALFEPGTTVAGVFTRSSMASAPVEWCRSNLAAAEASEGRALIVNAGNSNAFTGRAGAETVKVVGAALADLIGCRRRDVFQASTGVIGQPLNANDLTRHFERLVDKAAPASLDAAARAIMTTDTFPKIATATAMIDEAEVAICGIAKGSGMIAPDMATMLSFVFTDAAIPAPVLQTLLILAVRETFNAITVDGDTSTSDTVLMFATGKGAEHPAVSRPGDPRLADFREKLEAVLADLAKQVVRDGEGASKFIRVRVTGAQSAKSARTVAFAIGNSPLVKTAIAGEDANWGRVVMAVGKSGEPADRDKLVIKFGGLPVASKGGPDPRHDEKALTEYMTGTEVVIEVDLGIGKGEAEIWTCDLTHGYISINADYRS